MKFLCYNFFLSFKLYLIEYLNLIVVYKIFICLFYLVYEKKRLAPLLFRCWNQQVHTHFTLGSSDKSSLININVIVVINL
jgi:hypothetical protein